jgi:hypothetical protein
METGMHVAWHSSMCSWHIVEAHDDSDIRSVHCTHWTAKTRCHACMITCTLRAASSPAAARTRSGPCSPALAFTKLSVNMKTGPEPATRGHQQQCTGQLIQIELQSSKHRRWYVTVLIFTVTFNIKHITTAARLLEIQASDEAQQRDSSVLRQPQLSLECRLALRLACSCGMLSMRTRQVYREHRALKR